MSRSFLNVPATAYIGTPYAVGIPQAGSNARFVPIIVDWSVYGASTAKPNVAVNVDLGNRAATNMLNIRSCRIDNLGNPASVYVYFLDSNYTIVAPPNTIVQEFVTTQQLSCTIIGMGFTTGQIGQTTVYLSNVLLPSSFDPEISQALSLWKASANISRGTGILNSNYGVPALCDQAAGLGFNLAGGPGTVSAAFPFPQVTGFHYFNCLQATVLSTGDANGTTLCTIALTTLDGILADTFWNWNWLHNVIGGSAPYQIQFPIPPLMNIKVDAIKHYGLWFRTGASINATFSLQLGYTENPT